MGVKGAMVSIHNHPDGLACIEAAMRRKRNTTIVIGADQRSGVLLLDIDVQADVCADTDELRAQLRLLLEALDGAEVWS
jgi:hypothetical protein